MTQNLWVTKQTNTSEIFFTLNCFEKKGLVLVTGKNKKKNWKTKFLLIKQMYSKL